MIIEPVRTAITGKIWGLVVSLFLFSLAPAANAGLIRYEFNAFSSFETSGETFSGSFSVDLPDFVVSNTSIPVSDLTNCLVVVSPSASAQCRQQDFLFGIFEDYTTVSFGVSTDLNPATGLYYYFANTAFSTPGTYESLLFGQSQQGRLVVTDLSNSTGVPEPSTWALIALTLAGLVFSTRRRTYPCA